MDILYKIVDHAHSGLRYVVLALLLAAIFQALGKRRSGEVYPEKNKIALYAFMATHVQLLLGLVLYLFLTQKFNFADFDMSNKVERFYGVEHLTGMLVGIALITIGYIKAKRQMGINKGWKTIALFYTLGLLVILAMIPWPFRDLGAGWF